MHALGEYLTEELERRGWTQAELARRAGLTRQSVSNLLDPEKTQLGSMLLRHTFAGLSQALQVPGEDLVLKAAEAMGLPVQPVEPRSTWLAPEEAMAALERYLTSDDLTLAELYDYLRMYLRLATVVLNAIEEKSAGNS